MSGQNLYLEWHGNQWRVRIKVPKALRQVFGKSKLVYPLHTSDLAEANDRKWPIVARFKGEIANAKRALAKEDPIAVEAIGAKAAKLSEDGVWSKAESIGETSNWDDATRFLEIAKGMSTGITDELENFLEHKRSYRPKTAEDVRRVVGWLEQWLKDTGEPAFVEDVSKKVASRFIRDKLSPGRSRRKANAYLGFLRKYWEFMEASEVIHENVWKGVSLPEDARLSHNHEPDYGKRPFTDQEVAKLVYGQAPRYLPDLIRIAALSGMRLEEICRLRVRDCRDGVFKIHLGKTSSAAREVPIHKDLLQLVTRRCADKGQEDYLIEELPDPSKKTDVRSSPASKAFTRYRRSQGVDERPNGKLKSNVDLHSLRRWFAHKAKDGLERANGSYTAWTIAEVLGHDNEMLKALELTMSRYPGPSSASARKACVTAVNLPEKPAA